MHSILLLGASGYVGGALLVALKKSNPEYEITAVVRGTAQVDAIRTSGANTVIHASDNFLEKVESLSAKFDAVINAANNDDLDLASAVLRGLKKRFNEGRGAAALIHVSGTAIFLDGGLDGKANPKTKVWNDGSEDDIKAITPEMWHGNVDFPILKAGEEGYVNTYIVCPSIIYGVGSGALSKHGVFHRVTLSLAQNKGYAFYVGEGTTLAGTVHIDDVVSFLTLVLKKALSGPPIDSAYARYFIVNSEVVEWKVVAAALGKALGDKGLIASAEPKSVSAAEATPFGGFMGGNAVTKEVRARALGWKPTHEKPEFADSFAKDIANILAAV